MKEEMDAIVKKATEGTGLEGQVVAFDFGNSHFDHKPGVQGRPARRGPTVLCGQVWGDTDNWVWPRHTGDFSVSDLRR